MRPDALSLHRVLYAHALFHRVRYLAGIVTGNVTGVLDGDTIKVLNGHHADRIRLSGIDCSENGQAYSKKAKQAASTLDFGKEVTVQTHGLDKYKRILGDVILPDGMNLNHELVKQGWCWWYQKYAPGITSLKGWSRTHETPKKDCGLILHRFRHGSIARQGEDTRLTDPTWYRWVLRL